MKRLLLPLFVVLCLVGDTSTRAITANPASPIAPPQLGNISTRAFVQQPGANVMIGGFIINGTEPKTVIVRAIGPELTQYGVPNVLADPRLDLHDGAGAVIASNDNWRSTIISGIITSDQVNAIRDSGNAPTDGRESAIIATLQPGNYTAVVYGTNNTTGVALVEVYDLSPNTNSILGNISTRCFVQEPGANVMIGGFIVRGSTPKTVIIRAIGPGLTQYGVPNVLADPKLDLHDNTGAVIASNDNWRTTIIRGIIRADQVNAIRDSGYAPTDGRESAIIATLQPGNYTAVVYGTNNTTGVALVEMYDVDLRVFSVSDSAPAPFELIHLDGTGFNPTAAISIRFFNASGFSVKVPVVDATSTQLTIPAPVYRNPGTGAIEAGTVSWQVVQETAAGIATSETHDGLQLQTLPTLLSPPGSVSLSLLRATVDLANNHLATLTGTPWDTPQIRSKISNQITALNGLITNIQNLMADPARTFSLGSASGVSITVQQGDLGLLDRMIVGWLESISTNITSVTINGFASSWAIASSASSNNCGATEAGNFAQAATQGDPQLDQWAGQFVYAPRQSVLCATPDAFNTSYQVIGGAGAIGLGVLALAGVPAEALALPAAALLYVTIEGSGGMIALGGALNQTSDAARRLVEGGIAKLEELKYAPVKALLPTWTGSLVAIGLGSESLIDAFTDINVGPPPTPTPTPTPGNTTYDGSYSGTYSGEIACVTDPPSPPVPVPPSPVAFTVAGGVVTAYGNHVGTVDSFGHLRMTFTPQGSLGAVTFIGTIAYNGYLNNGTWSVSGLPPECTEGGGWSAHRN